MKSIIRKEVHLSETTVKKLLLMAKKEKKKLKPYMEETLDEKANGK